MFNFGEHLKSLRISRNLTQRQLADAIDASERGIQNYELGERKPAYDVLISLADYFDVSLDYLTGRSDCPDILTYDKNGDPIIIEAMATKQDEKGRKTHEK